MLGHIGDDVGVGQRLESLAAGQESREHDTKAEAQAFHERLGIAQRTHVVARDHQTDRLPGPGDSFDEHVDVLARGQLAEKQDNGRIAQTQPATQSASRERRRELGQIDGVGHSPNGANRHAGRNQLPVLGLGHGKDP
ncbi:MAG: hypothetical protein DMF90_06175 [Acidobacteria bacterium]|nr:MAG: hypothetical protein DMF90_06175 [Acidobacteriota bacterium]